MRRPVLLLALLAALSTAVAQDSFNVAPTVLNVNPARSLVASVTFTNTSSGPVRVDARAAAWSMAGGQHVEAPTRDLLLNPASFTVGPGESQLIRVGLRRRPTPGELTYRLHLDQRPLDGQPAPAASPGAADPQSPAPVPEVQARVRQLFSVTLPVYFTPGGTAPRLSFTLRRQGADLNLSVGNTGTRHETLHDLSLTRAGKTLRFAPNAVLAGGELHYALPGWGGLDGGVSLSYRTAAGETVRVTPTLP